MIDWIGDNAAVIQAAAAVGSVLIWIFYLQVLVGSLRRQRRTEILIHFGGAGGLDVRMFVSNLGLEPIYILDIAVSVAGPAGRHEASVIDRTEVSPSDLETPEAATLQGPLKSGEFVDIGSVADLLQRAAKGLSTDLGARDVDGLRVTVAAVTAARSSIVAAERCLAVVRDGAGARLVARTLTTRQIRGWWQRRRIARQIAARARPREPGPAAPR